MKVSLQLFSIREEIEQNGMRATLKKVKEMGYDGVEYAGFGGLTPEEMKEELEKNGLYSVGSHTGFELIGPSMHEYLSYNQKIGSKYMTVPWSSCETMEDIERSIKILNETAEAAKEYGIKIGYHNHEGEFKMINGKTALEYIAENTSEDVIFELDIFWVVFAGLDPYELVEKMGKRVELIHVKQIDGDRKNVAVPDGVIDFKKLKEVAKYATHFIVEQEAGECSERMAACARNAEYMKSI